MNGPDGSRSLLNEKQLAEYLNVGLSTLQHDRHNGKGIPYIKIGAAVRYQWQTVLVYLDANTINPGDAA